MSGRTFLVIPAQAGIQGHLGQTKQDSGWHLACEIVILDSRLRGNDAKGEAGIMVSIDG